MKITNSNKYKEFEKKFKVGDFIYLNKGGVSFFGFITEINTNNHNRYLVVDETDPDTMELRKINYSTKGDLMGAEISF